MGDIVRVEYAVGEFDVTRPAIHPGEILAEELMELDVSPTELARQINVPANRVSQIINGKRAITGDTALRLGHWFGNSAQFWLNFQSSYDLRIAEEESGTEIETLPVRPVQRLRLQKWCVNQEIRTMRYVSIQIQIGLS
jgi:addiction module HigA family antidote